jgi:Ca-activated chloride channel family protein
MQELWDRLDPGFGAPVWLLVGLVAMLAVALLEFGAHRRRLQAVRMFAASHLASALTVSVSPMKRLLKAVILVVAVGLLFVAMARPHLFFDWQEENRSGVDILLAVDCSKSMLTQDVKPSRLERAKLAIADFADRLPDSRLGLIAFAGDAFLQCPLTLDHDAFQTAVQELDTDTIPRPGTDMATAIDTAMDALKSQPNNMKFLILVTDGEDLEGRVIEDVKNAAQSGLKIYTVGVGTPEGDHIVERDDAGNTMYHQDANGQQVISKLDESTLRQIAEISGGAYGPLGQDGRGLDEIYNRYIAPLPKANLEERREKIHIEQFEWPLAAATLLLMIQFMIKDRASAAAAVPVATGRRSPHRRRARNSVGAASLIAFAFLVLPSRAGDADTAERDYKSGKFEDSAQHYEKAAEGAPDRNDLQYNRGDAAYKAGEFSEAEEAYRKALETPDLDLQENAYYNLGNALFQHGDAMQKVDSKKTINLWEQALHSYDSALKLKTNPDSQHNYDYVKKMLEELKKKQGSSGGQDKKDPSNNDQGDDGSGSSDQKKGGRPQDQNGQGNSGQDPSQGQPGDKNSQQANSKNGQNQNLKTYSGTRDQDLKDPNIKSKEDAENLLDSLKDDERHINARSLNGDNQVPPPPSGKDW